MNPISSDGLEKKTFSRTSKTLFVASRDGMHFLLYYICLSRYSKGMKLKDSQKVFAALADRTRLRILSLLSEGELCVCDLMRVLREPQSKISRHLSYLRRAGLVEGRKKGLWMHYRLSKPTAKLYGMLLEALCCCRKEFDEFGKDLKTLNQNKDCLVGCCK